ncbi:hypothetical protein BGZ74_004143 [Mortierella antarctica]|nr:hypothetical protein BGZ74_004143 [Mortierella antarctica]
MDVIAEAVKDVIDNFINGLEDETFAKDLRILCADPEALLIEQVDLLDNHTLLKASIKKAECVEKELRVRLLEPSDVETKCARSSSMCGTISSERIGHGVKNTKQTPKRVKLVHLYN